MHIEVLLPAFVLGSMISKNHNRIRADKGAEESESEDILELKSEKRVSFIVSAVFMVLVGLSMPLLEGVSGDDLKTSNVDQEIVDSYVRVEGDGRPVHFIREPLSYKPFFRFIS